MTGARKSSTEKNLTARARVVAENCLARTSRSLARKITQAFDVHLEPYGVSLPQFALLAHVAGAKDDTLGSLAGELGLDPSTLTRNLQGLEKLGFVEIASVEKDQRKRAVWLTEAGARKLAAAIPAWEDAQAKLSATLGAAFRSDLRKADKTL